MNIALTGATGFLGRHLVSHLAGAGHRLTCWCRPTSDLGHFPSPLPKFAVNWIEGVLGDAGAEERLVQGADAVVHAALDHPAGGFRGSEDDWLGFLQNNLMGTLRLIGGRSSRQGHAVRLHLLLRGSRPDPGGSAPRRDPSPLAGKPLRGLQGGNRGVCPQLRTWPRDADLRLRPTGIYGLAYPPRASKWYSLVERIVAGEPVECRRGGKEVHASDVARAVELLLTARAEAITGEAFNCCDRYVSDHEVASIALRLTGSSSTIQGEPTAPRNQIVTKKLEALGMTFGGTPLLERTIQQLIDSVEGR